MMHLLKLKFKDVSTQNFSFFLCSRVMQSQLQPLQTGCHNAYSRLNIIYIYYCYTAKKKKQFGHQGLAHLRYHGYFERAVYQQKTATHWPEIIPANKKVNHHITQQGY